MSHVARTIVPGFPITWATGAIETRAYSPSATAGKETHPCENLKSTYSVVRPGFPQQSEKGLARSLEETLLWMGVVDFAHEDDTGLFRLTELGVHLLTGNDDGKLAQRYRPKTSEIVVQPNFDIVVPTQDMDPLLTVPLDQFAVRASTGQATVYNLTKDSFTQAIQDGHDGEAFVAFLLAHNRGGELPANVMTTLDDWRGGMKRVRLKTIHVLESDDPLVIADLLHRRKYRKLLSPVEPRTTIVYVGIQRSDLSKDLEKDGFIVE